MYASQGVLGFRRFDLRGIESVRLILDTSKLKFVALQRVTPALPDFGTTP
jgi:hypothetical protein